MYGYQQNEGPNMRIRDNKIKQEKKKLGSFLRAQHQNQSRIGIVKDSFKKVNVRQSPPT